MVPVHVVTAGGTAGFLFPVRVDAPRGAKTSASFSYSDKSSYGDQSFITTSSAGDAKPTAVGAAPTAFPFPFSLGSDCTAMLAYVGFSVYVVVD